LTDIQVIWDEILMVTRTQIRGALAMLGWSLGVLRERSGKIASVNALSSFLSPKSRTSMGYDRVVAIQQTLIAAGIEFGNENWVNLKPETCRESKDSR
jgi:hypothetical protein